MALLGQNRNELASSAFILESDDSIGGCEQAVVPTAADVLPRLNTSSTLSVVGHCYHGRYGYYLDLFCVPLFCPQETTILSMRRAV